MDDNELIARQAKTIEEQKDAISELERRIKKAQIHIVCVGGPLNGNKLNFSSSQMFLFSQICEALEGN